MAVEEATANHDLALLVAADCDIHPHQCISNLFHGVLLALCGHYSTLALECQPKNRPMVKKISACEQYPHTHFTNEPHENGLVLANLLISFES
jgi:hypothetical protein